MSLTFSSTHANAYDTPHIAEEKWLQNQRGAGVTAPVAGAVRRSSQSPDSYDTKLSTLEKLLQQEGAGGGMLIVPSSIPNCKGWFESDYGIFLDPGGKVNGWVSHPFAPLVARDFYPVNGFGANLPPYGFYGSDTNKSVQCRADTPYTCLNATGNVGPFTTEMTIVLALHLATDAVNQGLILGKQNDNAGLDWHLQWNSSKELAFLAGLPQLFLLLTPPDTLAANDLAVITVRIGHSSAIRVNGVVKVTGAFDGSLPNLLDAAILLGSGGDDNFQESPQNVNFFALAFYDRALQDAEIRAIEERFTIKYLSVLPRPVTDVRFNTLDSGHFIEVAWDQVRSFGPDVSVGYEHIDPLAEGPGSPQPANVADLLRIFAGTPTEGETYRSYIDVPGYARLYGASQVAIAG